MGKALLLIVAGLGLATTSSLLQGRMTAGETVRSQANYEEELIAYQIARSAYNAAFAAVHEAATPIVGAAQVDGREGGLLNGDYAVSARPAGAQVNITATGYFGGHFNDDGEYVDGATRTVGDTRLNPGTLAPNPEDERQRRLSVRFLRSTAGYCSAVFVQRILPGTAPGSQPPPDMIFESGHNRYNTSQLDLQRETQFETLIAPGTQLNFSAAVDQGCVHEPHPSGVQRNNGNVRSVSQTSAPPYVNAPWRLFFQQYVAQNGVPVPMSPANFAQFLQAWREAADFQTAHYNYVHSALEGNTADLASMRESSWAFVQKSTLGGERWRIGFEDIHNTNWLTGTTPQSSLFLTKLMGFNGRAWVDRMTDLPTRSTPISGADGYADLTDSGSMPDFDDQTIEVWMEPVGPPIAEN